MWFLRYASGQTNRQTYRHADRDTSPTPIGGEVTSGRGEPIGVSGLDDAAADDEVATAAACGRCDEVDGQRNTVAPRNTPPVDGVEWRTVSTAADQLDHLRTADGELIGVSTRYARDAYDQHARLLRVHLYR